MIVADTRAEELGQRVRAQRDAGDDSKPAAAALQRPEEVGIRAGVGDPDLAVGGHDFRLDEARAGQSIGLREAAEAAAQDEPGDADRQCSRRPERNGPPLVVTSL